MKIRITILGIALCFFYFSEAAVITLDNSGNSGAHYSSFETAHDAANSGDTILIYGSGQAYSKTTFPYTYYIEKKLHIIGGGYKPNNQYSWSCSLVDITLISSALFNPSGTTIQGIKGLIRTTTGTGYPITDISISRCDLNTIYLSETASNWRIFNNIMGYIYIPSTSNVSSIAVYNNIFTNGLQGNWSGKSGIVEFNNNLFIGGTALDDLNECIFSNNIFYAISPYNSSHTYCRFDNNIAYGIAPDTFNLSGTNSGNGNFSGQNPSFTTITGTVYKTTDDYNLGSSSIGKNAGTDTTDIGIYGGAVPFPIGGASGSGYQTSAMPNWPQLYKLVIDNSIINASDSLRIIVKARQGD